MHLSAHIRTHIHYKPINQALASVTNTQKPLQQRNGSALFIVSDL